MNINKVLVCVMIGLPAYVQAADFAACGEAAALRSAWAAKEAAFSGVKLAMEAAQKAYNVATAAAKAVVDALAKFTPQIKSISFEANVADTAKFKSPIVDVVVSFAGKNKTVSMQLDAKDMTKQAAQIIRAVLA